MCSFISGCIDYEFDVGHANCDQQLPHDRSIWPELSRSNVRDTMVRRSTEIGKQRLDVFSKGHAPLSIDPGTIKHVQALYFSFKGEGSMAECWSLTQEVHGEGIHAITGNRPLGASRPPSKGKRPWQLP
jgi:hypothetical protein